MLDMAAVRFRFIPGRLNDMGSLNVLLQKKKIFTVLGIFYAHWDTQKLFFFCVACSYIGDEGYIFKALPTVWINIKNIFDFHKTVC